MDDNGPSFGKSEGTEVPLLDIHTRDTLAHVRTPFSVQKAMYKNDPSTTMGSSKNIKQTNSLQQVLDK